MTIARRSLLVFAAALAASPAMAQSTPSDAKVAIHGYDAVAYFTLGRPEQGNPSTSYQWDGRRYLFMNEGHRELFARDPEKYAPQFAGLCSAGMSAGKKIEADPKNWIISDGRLFLFSGATGPEQARNDPTLLRRANANWIKQH
ncbi:MAG: hypothetical protein EPO55_21995 [Reyranella sp.]|uniref:YHS domain-containing (seleno)protein n=1 Tax=Reyranella sp. TaxID=1929291 RepID=UPI00122753AB|nr:YHS domain-containing (seleno)protein [Reyranella sp.]TAJ36371.1 MAG: hypothetical protein EPO55_21995 [Reyranella sp.]